MVRGAARCNHIKVDGGACKAPVLQDSTYCFWHDPDHAQEAAEARRLGGLRRKREHTVAGAYDVEGLDSIPKIRRVVEIATLDTLGLENSVARNRTLIASATAAARLVEVAELEDRLQALEAAVQAKPALTDSIFDVDAHDPAIVTEANDHG